MKFKAELKRSTVRLLLSTCLSISKLPKSSTSPREIAVYLTETFFEIRTKPGELTMFILCLNASLFSCSFGIIFVGVKGGVQSFCKLNASCFDEFRVKSKADNTMGFVIYLDDFIGALRTGEEANELIVRLAKRTKRSFDDSKDIMLPRLSFSSEVLEAGLQVNQDVQIIKLLSQSRIRDYDEPRLPPPEITLVRFWHSSKF